MVFTEHKIVSKTFLELLKKRTYSRYTHPVNLAGVTKIIFKNEKDKVIDYCYTKIQSLTESLNESSNNAGNFGLIKEDFEDRTFQKAFFMVKILNNITIYKYIYLFIYK